MDTSVPPNALSGILFVLYVLAALALTAFLFSDLVRLASPGRTGTKAPSVTPQAWLLGLFALISFSLLSYNMLRFLLVHYRDWSVVRGLHLAPAGSGASFVSNDANLQNLAANVWQWLTEAGLFERFARELAGTEPALWWVQCALLHSVLVAVYLEIEGTCGLFVVRFLLCSGGVYLELQMEEWKSIAARSLCDISRYHSDHYV
jgi:hypothetical protein